MLFIFISCCFQQSFLIPVDTENERLKLGLAIPTGATITVANYAIEMLLLVTYKTVKDLPK